MSLPFASVLKGYLCVLVCAGFLGFLHLLCSHPWSAAPLLVDPAGVIKQEGRRVLQVSTAMDYGISWPGCTEPPEQTLAALLPSVHTCTCYMLPLMDVKPACWTKLQQLSVLASRLVCMDCCMGQHLCMQLSGLSRSRIAPHAIQMQG